MNNSLLKDENILLDVEAQNWQETIRKAAKPLLDDGSIEPCYVEAMINSILQYGPYIVIGKGVALAHARPEEGVNKLGYSVMILKEPVTFNHETNDPVSVVFCLAAIDNQSHLEILSLIVNLLNYEGKLEKLSNVKSIQECKEILFSEM